MNHLYVSFDVDWAPDFMIDWVADRLMEKQVRSTWFVTHASPALERLRRRPDLFELGIHPNFSANSTHGDNPAAVLRHCMGLVPEARIMRTHALIQSTPLLLQVMHETPIIADSSTYLPLSRGVEPSVFWYESRQLVRIVHTWEDDFEISKPNPGWSLVPRSEQANEARIFAFHPAHLYLNSQTHAPYAQLKERARPLVKAFVEDAQDLVAPGAGPRTLLDDLLVHLSGRPHSTIGELAQEVLTPQELTR